MSQTKKYPKPRTLSAKYSTNITDEHLEQLAKEIAKEIDEEIVNDIVRGECMKKGWVKAPFTIEKFVYDPLIKIEDVSAWIHINATGEYRIFGREFWFQRKRDLTAFILRWS